MKQANLRSRFSSRHVVGIAVSIALAAACPGANAQEKPIAAISNGKVRIEVLSLKRIEGDLITLRWQVINDDTRNFSMTMGNQKLIDLIGRREYRPGITSTDCDAQPTQRKLCWATFAGPPANTKTMAFKIYEGFELLTGIPVSD